MRRLCTTFSTRFTTFSPSKYRRQTPTFSKTPLKNGRKSAKMKLGRP
jgi:hypothetical protein